MLAISSGCGNPKPKPDIEETELFKTEFTASLEKGQYASIIGEVVEMKLEEMSRAMDRFSTEDQERARLFIEDTRASLQASVEAAYPEMVEAVVNSRGQEQEVGLLISKFATNATKAKWETGSEERMVRQREIKTAKETKLREERLHELNKGIMLRFSQMSKTLKKQIEEHLRKEVHPTPLLVMDTALMPIVSRSMVVVDCTAYMEYESYASQLNGRPFGTETKVAKALRLKVRVFSQDPGWSYDEAQSLEVVRELPENMELSPMITSRPNPRVGEEFLTKEMSKKLGDLKLPEAKQLEELAQARKPANTDPNQNWIKITSTTLFKQVFARSKPPNLLKIRDDGGPETLAGKILSSLRPRCGNLPMLTAAEAEVWQLKREPVGVLSLAADVLQTPYLKNEAIMYKNGGSVPTSVHGSLTVSGEACKEWAGTYEIKGSYSPPDTLSFNRISEQSFDALQHLADDMISSLSEKLAEPAKE